MFDKQTDDRGVSPVVGVILMVAITVILAAVIGTFVLNLGGQVQQNAQAGVDISQEPGSGSGVDVNFTVVSMENADKVNFTTTDIGGNSNNVICDGTSSQDDGVSNTAYCSISSVGNGGSFDGMASGDTVQVKGTLKGKTSVLQTFDVQ